MTHFEHKPSAIYLDTLQAMRKLFEAEGVDSVSRVYADAVADNRRAAWSERLKLKETRGETCIQPLLGKRCRNGNMDDSHEHDIPGADHQTLWVRDGKPYAYVSQPYGLDWHTLVKMVEFCQRNGLQADIGSWPSWHFPGWTLSVVVKNADTPPE